MDWKIVLDIVIESLILGINVIAVTAYGVLVLKDAQMGAIAWCVCVRMNVYSPETYITQKQSCSSRAITSISI